MQLPPFGEDRATLRARNRLAYMEDELAANEAFEADAANECSQLLVERPVERSDAHSIRNTPVTRPRISTCSG
jgi:hypothetical protein